MQTMLKVEKIADNLHRISVGNPDSNAYVVNGDTMIDSTTGMHTGMLMKGLERLGINAADIKRIINTHHHIEHVGGNLLFNNAKTFLHTKAAETWEKNDKIKTHAIMFPVELKHLRADVYLEHNHSININDSMMLKVLQSPDNDDGHICLFDQKTGFLFSGDTELGLISDLNLPITKVLPAHGEPYDL